MAANSGCYLLAVVAEPISEEDKQIILQRLNKGLLSWDVESTGCDLTGLENACANVKDKNLEDCDVLIQYSTERLGVEVLVNPPVSTLKQCIKNLLTSTIEHKHIIHAGYTFTGSGSWILQNGAYSYREFLSAFQDAQNRTTRSLHVHCVEEGDWTTANFSKEVFTKVADVSLNPPDKMDHLAGAEHLVNCLESVLKPLSLTEIMKASPLVGNIRFNRPTLYLFPAGQGDCALFGINGFNMLVDGGFNRKPCPWEFIRHLDRLDAVLVTRLSESNLCSMSTLMKRKTLNSTYPQIGYVFCNIAEGKCPAPTDEIQKDRNDLLVSVVGEGHNFMNTLNNLNLVPHQCSRDNATEPFVLYHKVGHGTLEMHVLCPPRDSKEMKDFLSEWSSYQEKFTCVKSGMKNKDATPIPLSHATSVCAILVWRPSDPKDTITRILFPGSAPQSKILEGLEKLKNLDILKHPTVSKASLRSFLVPKPKSKVDGLIKSLPNRKNTASPVLPMNGDISGPKKEIMKVSKEVKKIIKEVKKDAKALKEVKKESKDVKETKKEIKKDKEPKPTTEKKAPTKTVTKKTEPISKTNAEVKQSPTLKKTTAKKEPVSKLQKEKVDAPKKSAVTSKVNDSKVIKDVMNKKTAETKTPKPKPKTPTATKIIPKGSPTKAKTNALPKSPSKLSRAFAASATVATAAVTVGVAELIKSKREEDEKEELLEMEIEDKAPVNNRNDLNEDELNSEEHDEQVDIPTSPVRHETMSPALSEPVSLTASDTLSSAPMETVSPIPQPPELMSPAEEKDVNEMKEFHMQMQHPETNFENDDIIERADTPVLEDDDMEKDVEEVELQKEEVYQIENAAVEPVRGDEEIDELVKKDVMATSFIGESLETAFPDESPEIPKEKAEAILTEKSTTYNETATYESDTKTSQDCDFTNIQKEGDNQSYNIIQDETMVEKSQHKIDIYEQEYEHENFQLNVMERSAVFEEGDLVETEVDPKYDDNALEQPKKDFEGDYAYEQEYQPRDIPLMERSSVFEENELMETESNKLAQMEYETFEHVESNETCEHNVEESLQELDQLINEKIECETGMYEQKMEDQFLTEKEFNSEGSGIFESKPPHANVESEKYPDIPQCDNLIASDIITQDYGVEETTAFRDQNAYEPVDVEHLQTADDSRESEDDVDLQRYMTKETPDNLSTVSARDSDSDVGNSPIHRADINYDNTNDQSMKPAKKEEESNSIEAKQAFSEEKDHDSAEDNDEEMICHPIPPDSEEFYMKVGPCDDDDMRDPIGPHYITAPSLRSKMSGEEPLYEEPEYDDSGSERSQSPIIEQPIFSSTNKADFPELVTVSGGTTPSEPQSPKSPLDIKKGNLANLGVEVMDALSEHDLSESSTHSPLVKVGSNAFDSESQSINVLTKTETGFKTSEEQDCAIKQLDSEFYPEESLHDAETVPIPTEFMSEVPSYTDKDQTHHVETDDELIHETEQKYDDIHEDIVYEQGEVTMLKQQYQEDFNLSEGSQIERVKEQEMSLEYIPDLPPSGFENEYERSYTIPTGNQDYQTVFAEIHSTDAETYSSSEIRTSHITKAAEFSDFHYDSNEQYGRESSVDPPASEEYLTREENQATQNYNDEILNVARYSTENIMDAQQYSNGINCSSHEAETTDAQGNINLLSGYTETSNIDTAGFNGQHSGVSPSSDTSSTEKPNSREFSSSELGKCETKTMSGGQETLHTIESHYQTDSPEDNSMKNYSSPDIVSPMNPEITPDPLNPFADRGYVSQKFIPGSIDPMLPDNLNRANPLLPQQPSEDYRDTNDPYSDSTSEEEDSSSIPGNVSPYAYTNKAYDQEEEDADGNHIYDKSFKTEQDTEVSRNIFDENNPQQFAEYIESQPVVPRNSVGFQDTNESGYSNFRLEEWGKPMGLPTPPEAASKVAKKPVKPPSSSNKTNKAASGEKRPSQENGKSQATSVASKVTSSPAKKAKEPSSPNTPFYVDLAYVPHHGDPSYSDVEFFKKVRARYYVFSGINPSKEVLNALLEAKKSWNEDLEVTIIPTYETDTLGYWMAQNQDALAKYSIEVAPSASRCTVNLQDHETSCAAYRLEF